MGRASRLSNLIEMISQQNVNISTPTDQHKNNNNRQTYPQTNIPTEKHTNELTQTDKTDQQTNTLTDTH